MRISPKEFLKKRRPKEFSDSIKVSETSIDRLKLEHYFETLSSRNQELEFEGFAKSLCEVEVCPNLLPHTGPSGGGDSKVDSETYPVSEATAEGWYIGIDKNSSKDRWGFAFSIKKDWLSKVKADIKRISGTKRDYKVAYFVSSRYIPDKKRAFIEDELTKTYRIDVRILDRSWILDKIFSNHRLDLVRQKLHVEVIEDTVSKMGPMDLHKEEYLAILEKKIEEAISQKLTYDSLVESSIKAAILSRELERPRTETDGRFIRAERLAKNYGNSHHRFDVAYQYAWTTYWWHEDFATYFELYKIVESLALKSGNVFELERLTNLWYGLWSLQSQNLSTWNAEAFNQHTKQLKSSLKKLSKEEEHKPSASLFAKALFLLITLSENLALGQSFDKTLKELKTVVIDSKDLMGFPFQNIIKILTQNGDVLEKSSEYNELFKIIEELVESRDGEVSSAKLLLDRGERLLELDRFYEAIQILGRSLAKLYKNESRNEIVVALFLISIAYENVGLYWAARGSLLTAASLATSSIWNYGEFNTMQAACYTKLKWLELKLGRIPQAMEWHQVDQLIRNALVRKGFEKSKILEQLDKFDLALGVLFLRADLKTLKTLELLPDTLSELGLDNSFVALIYSLGCVEQLPIFFTEVIPEKEQEVFFKKWGEQYSPNYLPSVLEPDDDNNFRITSSILGCTFRVVIEKDSPCIEVAESVLAAMESFLSTSMLLHAGIIEPEVRIDIKIESEKELISYSIINDDNNLLVKISCQKFNPHSVSLVNQKKLKDLIFKIVVDTISRIVMFKDFKNDLKAIMKDERAAERALGFTGSFVTLGNVLGYNPKRIFAQWINSKNKRYPLVRTEPLRFSVVEDESSDKKPQDIKGDPLKEAKHSDIKNISLIRASFWDEAKWVGAGFALVPDGRPPIFSILFNNLEVGKRIFEGFRNKVGRIDEEDKIRITIVEGIDKDKPHNYRVGVSTNIKESDKDPSKLFQLMTRIHTMTPQSSQNINNFKKWYEVFKCYILTPGGMGIGGVPEIIFSHGILKREVNLRQAFEIGINDVDSALVLPDDNPFIPSGIKNPPVKDLLKKKSGMKMPK